MLLEFRVSLKNNSVLRSLHEIISIDISTEWHKSIIYLESISHRDIFWMTGKWYNISTFESRKLIENCLTYFRESRSISTWIISLCTSLSLDWLECHASDTFLFCGEFQYFPDFMIILSLFHDYYQSSRDIVLIEVFYCLHAYFCQISSTYLLQVFTLERVKLEIYLKIRLIG